MVDIFLRTLPFFAIIGLGYWAGRSRFFTEDATAYLALKSFLSNLCHHSQLRR